ncbi:Uncharacterised protein [Serratia fonticola]|uniref:Virulence factor Mce family protein n=1 Tax=Serratia fonticola TaxID=47917 RepID=A0A4U9TW86_SERFO|nr:Uncharacterised protein [Serratia fonticola]
MLTGEDGAIPVIIATPSPLTQLLANGEDVMSNVNQVLVRLNQLMTPDNQQRLVNTLDNLEQITSTVAGQREDIRTILQQLALVTKQSNDTLAQTNRLVRNATCCWTGRASNWSPMRPTPWHRLRKPPRCSTS